MFIRQTYFLDIESSRREVICTMLKAYKSASPMLIKLESLVEGTSTGNSSGMQLFYERYEHKIFTALISCLVRNLEYFNSLLIGNKAVFQIDAILVVSEVVLRPGPSEILTIITQNVKNLMETLKVFPRWMAETCYECKPIKQAKSEEFVTFSFYEDVMSLQVTLENYAMQLRNCFHLLHITTKPCQILFEIVKGA